MLAKWISPVLAKVTGSLGDNEKLGLVFTTLAGKRVKEGSSLPKSRWCLVFPARAAWDALLNRSEHPERVFRAQNTKKTSMFGSSVDEASKTSSRLPASQTSRFGQVWSRPIELFSRNWYV